MFFDADLKNKNKRRCFWVSGKDFPNESEREAETEREAAFPYRFYHASFTEAINYLYLPVTVKFYTIFLTKQEF